MTTSTAPRRDEVRAEIGRRREEMLEFLSALVRCESVSGAEFLVTDLLESWLAEHGWSYERQPLTELAAAQRAGEPDIERRANIIARPRPPRPGRPTLVVNGHIDVVPPGDSALWTHTPFSGRRVDGRLYGRGAVDTKGPIAAGLYAVNALAPLLDSLPFDIAVQLVCAEETTGIGTRATFSRLPDPSAAIVLEPTNGVPAPIGTGLLFFEIQVTGIAAHTSAPWRGADAFQHLLRIHQALTVIADERGARFGERYRRYFGDIPTPVPFAVGTVSAGTWRAAVPAAARMAGRWGTAPGEDLDELRRELEAVLARVDAEAGWSERPTRIEWQHELPGWQTPLDNPLVAAAQAATTSVTGSDRLTGLTAGTDAAQYGPKGIPTLIYGPGDTALAHGADEFIEEDAVEIGAQVIAELLLEYAERSR
ncbi:M20 family metallopeptidase [Nocardia panacis]|nr:ArgE/DapE family deacylase [Nocardia panacis]